MKYGKNCGLLMLACWCLFAKKGSSIIAHVIAHVGGAGGLCVFEYLLKACICKSQNSMQNLMISLVTA